MTNDQFLLFPMLSYGYKNTVGAVAHLFFSDPPFAPHATTEETQMPEIIQNSTSVIGDRGPGLDVIVGGD